MAARVSLKTRLATYLYCVVSLVFHFCRKGSMVQTASNIFARLMKIDPTLSNRVLRDFSREDIQRLADGSGVAFWRVRRTLYSKIFLRTWRLKAILAPDSGATPACRHWATITLEAYKVRSGLKQMIPAGWPPSRSMPLKQVQTAEAVIRHEKANRQLHSRHIRTQQIILKRYKF